MTSRAKKTAHASSPSSPGRLKRRLPIRPRAQGRYQPFPRRDQSGSTALHMDRRPSIHACFDDDIYRERGRLLAVVPHVLYDGKLRFLWPAGIGPRSGPSFGAAARHATPEDHLRRDSRHGRAWRARLLIIIAATAWRCMPTAGLTDVRLSDREPRFVCAACGKRGAEVRPDFNWNRSTVPATG
jgi:hypothetical protein